MKIIIKDLPKDLDTDNFTKYISLKHTINQICFLKGEDDTFRRIVFVDVPVDQSQAFIRYHNNSYYERMKIRCEINKKITFADNPKEEAVKKCGRVKSFEIDEDKAKVEFVKIHLETLFSEIEKKNLVVCEKIAPAIKKPDGVFNAVDEALVSASSKNGVSYLNTLFFNFNKVLGSVKSKSKVLSSDPGARLAYLESELVNETKHFLETNSIYLDNLVGTRSRTTLLVRDFSVSDIPKNCEATFAPSQAIALLKFKNARDAMHWCSKFDKAEFLPLSTKPEKTTIDTHKLIVKNVPFQAEAAELKKLFQTKAKVKDVRIPVKRDSQSRGFAFVECATKEDALKILDWFGVSTHLYGRRLVIEPSGS